MGSARLLERVYAKTYTLASASEIVGGDYAVLAIARIQR